MMITLFALLWASRPGEAQLINNVQQCGDNWVMHQWRGKEDVAAGTVVWRGRTSATEHSWSREFVSVFPGGIDNATLLQGPQGSAFLQFRPPAGGSDYNKCEHR
jgi:hypothetical protein